MWCISYCAFLKADAQQTYAATKILGLLFHWCLEKGENLIFFPEDLPLLFFQQAPCSTNRGQSLQAEDHLWMNLTNTRLWEKVPGHPPAAHAPSYDDRPLPSGSWKHAAIAAAS